MPLKNTAWMQLAHELQPSSLRSSRKAELTALKSSRNHSPHSKGSPHTPKEADSRFRCCSYTQQPFSALAIPQKDKITALKEKKKPLTPFQGPIVPHTLK